MQKKTKNKKPWPAEISYPSSVCSSLPSSHLTDIFFYYLHDMGCCKCPYVGAGKSRASRSFETWEWDLEKERVVSSVTQPQSSGLLIPRLMLFLTLGPRKSLKKKEVKACDIKAEGFIGKCSADGSLANTRGKGCFCLSHTSGWCVGLTLTPLPLGWPFCTRQNLRPDWDFKEPSYYFFSPILPIPTRLFCVTLSLHSTGFLAVVPFPRGDQKSVMGAESTEHVHIKP